MLPSRAGLSTDKKRRKSGFIFKSIHNPHLWVIIPLFVLLSIVYYSDYLGITEWAFFNNKFFTREYPHDLHRTLFLVPLIYSAYVFRIRGAVVVSVLLLCILLPYSITEAQYHNSILRTLVFITAAIALSLILGHLRKQTVHANRDRDLTMAILQGSDDAIIHQTLEGIITVWSSGAERIYGYSAREAIGKHVSMLAPPDYADGPGAIMERVLQGEHIDHFETKRLTKNGRLIDVSLTVTPIKDIYGNNTGFSGIGRDITERKKAEENLRTYAELITEAQEEERKRIARELHDDTAQELASLALYMDLFMNKSKELSKKTKYDLEQIRTRIVNIQTGIRRFSQDLRPTLLTDFGCLTALQWLANDLTNNYGLNTSVKLYGKPHRLSSHTEIALYRIIQEALNNIKKHANASHVVIQVIFGEKHTTLVVSDDGSGFDVPKNSSEFVPLGKLGILGMHERVRLINATIEIKSGKDKGTIITVEVQE